MKKQTENIISFKMLIIRFILRFISHILISIDNKYKEMRICVGHVLLSFSFWTTSLLNTLNNDLYIFLIAYNSYFLLLITPCTLIQYSLLFHVTPIIVISKTENDLTQIISAFVHNILKTHLSNMRCKLLIVYTQSYLQEKVLFLLSRTASIINIT